MRETIEAVAAADTGDDADGVRGYGKHFQCAGGGSGGVFAEADKERGIAGSDSGGASRRITYDDAYCAEGDTIISKGGPFAAVNGESFGEGTTGAGLSEPGISLQGDSGETGDQL